MDEALSEGRCWWGGLVECGEAPVVAAAAVPVVPTGPSRLGLLRRDNDSLGSANDDIAKAGICLGPEQLGRNLRDRSREDKLVADPTRCLFPCVCRDRSPSAELPPELERTPIARAPSASEVGASNLELSDTSSDHTCGPFLKGSSSPGGGGENEEARSCAPWHGPFPWRLFRGERGFVQVNRWNKRSSTAWGMGKPREGCLVGGCSWT